MPDYPVRILECVNKMDRAGLETMLMNYYRHIDRSKVQFDFLTHRPDQGEYDDEIESLGGKIYHAPRLYPQNYIKYFQWMKRFFTTHHYPVVHSHIDAMSVFPLVAAKRAGVPVRIAHSHNDAIDKDFKYIPKQLFRKLLPLYATNFWACSKKAGIFLFGRKNVSKIHVLYNAIDLKSFAFNYDIRIRMRKALGLHRGEIAIGHVGRFAHQKNHEQLIRIVRQLVQEGVDFTLFLVGEGKLEDKIRHRVNELNLGEHVCFLGLRSDVANLLQAFDVIAFPSLHEGISVALIEAQAAGLPIVASDCISSESLITPNTKRLSLSAPIEDWASSVVRVARQGRCADSVQLLTDAGYDIRVSARKLQNTYLSLWPGR